MKPETHPIMIRIRRENDIYYALKEADRLTAEMGFHQAVTLRIKTAVSELARNILKYAGQGRVTLSAVQSPKKGIEILVSDNGPGIENVEEALSDHFSTGGTLGLGLPGVKRMMDEFEIDTGPGRGTKITIRKWI